MYLQQSYSCTIYISVAMSLHGFCDLHMYQTYQTGTKYVQQGATQVGTYGRIKQLPHMYKKVSHRKVHMYVCITYLAGARVL
jgi:hypothetical protein